MMHITGLMIMGGYGALRKTPGDIPMNIFFGKNIFIVGSLLSVLCGLLFICIAAISIKKFVENKLFVHKCLNFF